MNPLLRMAVLAGSNKALSLHLKRMPDLDTVDEKGMSLLMLAAARGYSETCRVLLEAGSDPHLQNVDGLSALCLAKANGYTDTASMISAFLTAVPEEPAIPLSPPNADANAHLEPQYAHNDTATASPDDWDEEPDSEIPDYDHPPFLIAGIVQAGESAHLQKTGGPSALCVAEPHVHMSSVSLIPRFMDVVPEEPEIPPQYTSRNEPPEPHFGNDDPEYALLDAWDEDCEPEIPQNDHALFSKARDAQALISTHRPNDHDDDWMDIDVDLPEFTWSHAETYLLHDCLPTERKLFLHGIHTGRLVSWQLDAMAELAEDQPDGYAERLQVVLNDLGIRIDRMSCDYIHPCCLQDHGDEEDEPEVQLAEEAIRFLWEKNNPAHDPDWLFMRDVRSFPMLDASEEISLGRMAAEGCQEILEAAMLFPPAVAELIEIVKSGGGNIVVGLSGTDKEWNVSSGVDGSDDDSTVEAEISGADDADNPDHESVQLQGELVRKMKSVSDLYAKVVGFHGTGGSYDECSRVLQLIHEELAGIRFSTEVLFRLADAMHGYWKTLRDYLDTIRVICTTKAGMKPEYFEQLFCGNETDFDWCRRVMDSHTGVSASAVANHSSEILDQQIRLRELESCICPPLPEFIRLCGKLQSGEKKLRQARYRMTVSNLRLAHHIATKYQSRLPLSDLVQEANLGLMKAVERFDYRRGFRFSTFATWWIRQSVTRAIADKSRSIRIPVHMLDSLTKVRQAVSKLEMIGAGAAAPEEIAEVAQLPLDKVLKLLNLPGETLSLDALEEENPGFVETLPDESDFDPEIETLESMCSEEIVRVLATLSPKEEKIIRMRFGIGEEKDYTLEEIGHCFDVTRERIRQIELKALRKLQHPSRSKILKAFVL